MDSKAFYIEATQNLAKMSFEGLMGNLKAFEVQLSTYAEVPKKDEAKLDAKKPKEDRNLAFKALKAFHNDSSDSMWMKLRFSPKQSSKGFDEEKWARNSGSNGNEKFVPRCYRCNEKGHLKT